LWFGCDSLSPFGHFLVPAVGGEDTAERRCNFIENCPQPDEVVVKTSVVVFRLRWSQLRVRKHENFLSTHVIVVDNQ